MAKDVREDLDVEKVTYGMLSWPLRFSVIGGWITLALFAFGFLKGLLGY